MGMAIGARLFTDRSAASVWYEATFRAWELSLSAAERDALGEYKSAGFELLKRGAAVRR